METVESNSIADRITKIFLREPKPFTKKRDINWTAIKISAGCGIGGVVLILLLMPAQKPEVQEFVEKVDSSGNKIQSLSESNPTADAWSQMQQSQSAVGTVPRSMDYLSSQQGGGLGGSMQAPNRSSAMILTRGGIDTKTQLPPGTKIRIRICESHTLTTQSVPLLGLIVADVEHENSTAIPSGAKVIGEMSFDESTERASVVIRSIQMPDGRERQISAIGVGKDGQYGIDGNVHSEAFKNSVGQTLTRFIGAYAEGSMARGQLGASQGGHENGMKNAVAETAKDRAEAWGEDLKKENKWIEISAGNEFSAVLNQPFSFRDPGGTYGN
ncbi:MAG TPA: TrbI/VirB10 family protein [Pseudobdellovibrionaceae bacterium]|nr:TrbI/VirB10 family protein [Pseudobdellovibrionaceae bacterium]